MSIPLPSNAINFRDAAEFNPKQRARHAETVYRAVMDSSTGEPKEQYLHLFKALMITSDQIKDLKVDDFKKEGVSDKVAQMRYKFHRENRINRLT